MYKETANTTAMSRGMLSVKCNQHGNVSYVDLTHSSVVVTILRLPPQNWKGAKPEYLYGDFPMKIPCRIF